jgi:Winged helix DNA-binding domain
MPPDATVTDDAARRHRLAAQLLDRPPARSAVEIVRRLAGVQAQLPSAAALGVAARADGVTPAAVEHARTADRSIVLTWAMRGTLHLICSEDYGWLVPLATTPRIANARRRLMQEGVDRDAADKAVRLIRRMLEQEGPLARPEIVRELRARGVEVEGQAVAHILWLAAAHGVACYGPGAGRAQRFALVDDWIGAPRRVNRDTALKELGIRYLRAHAPAEPADLAHWGGIALGDARRAWRAVEPRLIEVSTSHGPRWRLRSTPREARPDSVRLLPAFDEFLLGWRDREFIAPPQGWAQINRGGGWLRPVVLVDGRAVGIWDSERTGKRLRVTLRPWGRVSSAVRADVDEEARRLGRFLDAPAVEVSIS